LESIANSFLELLTNRDLCAVGIKVDSINSHRALLLQLFDTNRAIRFVSISGRWTEEHVRFCEALSILRPDVDIQIRVDDKTDLEMILRVARSNQRSSDHQSTASASPMISWVHTLNSKCHFAGYEFCDLLAPALKAMSSL
jgi:hypothetical protein